MWELIVKGQWFMAPLLVCSVLTIAVMLERFLTLRAQRREAKSFLAEFDRLIRSRDLAGARALCEARPSVMAGMMLAGLNRYEELRRQDSLAFMHDQVNRSIEEHGNYAVAELETHLGLLAGVGTIAPLLGFAGTVTGMIEAFDAIAQSNDINITLVAAGISEALITTAAGLLIAIPAIIAFNYFTKQIGALTAAMESSANSLIGELVRVAIDHGEARTSRP
jgi:biopolymer transport protein ExbB